MNGGFPKLEEVSPSLIARRPVVRLRPLPASGRVTAHLPFQDGLASFMRVRCVREFWTQRAINCRRLPRSKFSPNSPLVMQTDFPSVSAPASARTIELVVYDAAGKAIDSLARCTITSDPRENL